MKRISDGLTSTTRPLSNSTIACSATYGSLALSNIFIGAYLIKLPSGLSCRLITVQRLFSSDITRISKILLLVPIVLAKILNYKFYIYEAHHKKEKTMIFFITSYLIGLPILIAHSSYSVNW